ncbi:hypothetical protein MBCUT_17130 [Methanobrevibacter cuticularis]|uniref:Uncharacterized protein n=1 Tax=Methanobrevibacter cuticularis TaxID=47311 RepID=A0A166D1N9_9EURY|nr:hypothetical protein MBCUT_17130 [Methanobrevibacter cuticularis]
MCGELPLSQVFVDIINVIISDFNISTPYLVSKDQNGKIS